jgi:ribosomal protein L37AE/L43A
MTYLVGINLESTTCWCGISFAIPANLYRHLQDVGGDVFCPKGHSGSYGETENAKLRKQVAEIEFQKRQVLEDNGRLERKLKRVENGCCPHCQRHFKNLARHIQTKHKK